MYDELLRQAYWQIPHTNWGSQMRLPYYDYVIRKDNPVGLVQGYKSLGFYTVDDFNVSADGVWTLKAWHS